MRSAYRRANSISTARSRRPAARGRVAALDGASDPRGATLAQLFERLVELPD